MNQSFSPTALTIHTDGGARGNPGSAAIGFVVESEGKIIFRHGECIGVATNNIAEYTAVVSALQWLIKNQVTKSHTPPSIHFYLDSSLVVNQINGKFKVKQASLKSILATIINLLNQLNLPTTFTYVPRAQNTLADALVNQALDSH